MWFLRCFPSSWKWQVDLFFFLLWGQHRSCVSEVMINDLFLFLSWDLNSSYGLLCVFVLCHAKAEVFYVTLGVNYKHGLIFYFYFFQNFNRDNAYRLNVCLCARSALGTRKKTRKRTYSCLCVSGSVCIYMCMWNAWKTL